MRIAAIAACLLLLSACSSSEADPAPTATPKPADVGPAARLNDIGWFCEPTDGPDEAHALTSETCRIDGENVSLYTFASTADREDWRAEVNEPTCDVLVGRTLYTVEYDTTVIAPVSEKMARELAAALPADLRELNC